MRREKKEKEQSNHKKEVRKRRQRRIRKCGITERSFQLSDQFVNIVQIFSVVIRQYLIIHFYPGYFQDGHLFHLSSQKCVQAIDNTDNGGPAPSLQTCSDSLHQKWFFQERL